MSGAKQILDAVSRQRGHKEIVSYVGELRQNAGSLTIRLITSLALC
jgi:hypothetical protein